MYVITTNHDGDYSVWLYTNREDAMERAREIVDERNEDICYDNGWDIPDFVSDDDAMEWHNLHARQGDFIDVLPVSIVS